MNNSARKDEIAKGVQRQIKEAVEAWLATGEFDLHERVHGIILQALTSYEEERTPHPSISNERRAELLRSTTRQTDDSPVTADDGAQFYDMDPLTSGELRRLLEERTPSGEGSRYPLLWQRGETIRSVPEDLARRAYIAYARMFGTDQSFERMRERGGFSPGEMDEFVPGWRDDPRVKDATPPASRGEGASKP